MMKEYDKNYLIEEYIRIHADPNIYSGAHTAYHAAKIKSLIDRIICRSILDYGSGKGDQYYEVKLHEKYFNNIMPVLYDPGILNINNLPNQLFDLVICTDVLEHIPENLLTETLTEIYNKATSGVYLGICNTEAKTTLSDGNQVHLTRKRGGWWTNRIKPFATKLTYLHVYGKLGDTDIIFDSTGIKEFPGY